MTDTLPNYMAITLIRFEEPLPVEEFSGVEPGYHMNKAHWNTVVFDGSFDDDQAKEWIDDSYDLIVSGLTKKLKAELETL